MRVESVAKAAGVDKKRVVNVENKRVVLDTNIWLSAAISKSGAPAQVVRRVLQMGVPVFSKATFAELEARLWKPKFDRYLSMETRRAILHDANAVAHWVDIPNELAAQTYSRDPDDDKFIHTAVAASAAWLVTGDQDLLVIETPLPVRILTAGEALLEAEFCYE
jgi:putative PIN family toxin of toxin-antitoxin system